MDIKKIKHLQERQQKELELMRKSKRMFYKHQNRQHHLGVLLEEEKNKQLSFAQ